MRDCDLKSVRRKQGDKVEQWLFDLALDVGEKNDLLAERPAEVDRLKRLLAKWENDVRPQR